MQHQVRILCISTVFLFLSISAFAQGPFVPGHIYTVTKDTISGFIKQQSNADLAMGCTFKPTQKGTSHSYGLDELTGFRFDDENRSFNKRMTDYRSINRDVLTPYREVFLETLVSGKIELYYWLDYKAGDILYLSVKGDTMLIPLPFSQQEGYVDDGYTRKRTVIMSTDHQDTLRKYMQDRPDLFKDIEMIKKPKVENITKLLQKYNNNNNNAKKEALQVRKSPSTLPFSLYFTPGIANSKFEPIRNSTYDYYGGASFSVGLTGKNDNLLLNVGYYKRMFKGNPTYQEFHAQSLIPINLEYRFTGKWFRPYVSMGMTRFTNIYGSRNMLAPSAGFYVKIINRVSLVYQYAIDLDIYKIDGIRVYATYYAMSAGIQFRL